MRATTAEESEATRSTVESLPSPRPSRRGPAALRRRRPARRRGATFAVAAATLAAAAAVAGAGATAYVWYGGYDVASLAQHTQPVHSLLAQAMKQSVRRRAHDIEPPVERLAARERGAALYRQHCEDCHGGPGVAPVAAALSMQPLPGPLIDAARRWRPNELYWITRNGIKMSGMPAWAYRLPDLDLWAVVAFVESLPLLSPQDYRERTRGSAAAVALAAAVGSSADAGARPSPVPDPRRGRTALHQYGCNACHRIPGVTGDDTDVGPPLAGMANRRLIAGAVANTPEQMVQWIVEPRSIDPETAMPAMRVSRRDAADMAAYLATLR
ncbi:MAG: c-type cytochrome [Lautropia sp.]